MPPLLRELLLAHRRLIAVILGATLVSMLMSLALPWPLKVVLDNVVAGDPPPAWIAWLVPMMGGHEKAHIAAAAGVATVVIALVSGASFYVASYTTERLGQCIGNDLRVRLYHHLQELSLAYYDANRVGTILSTLTTDVQTIQNFASTSTLNILTDTLTLVAMAVVMVILRWDFALIALAITPVLVIFLVRVNRAIKVAVSEVRTRQSDLLATLQEGLQSIEVVQAYSREDYTDRKVQTVSQETVSAWLKTRRVSALLTPVVGVVIAACTGLVLWRGALLVLHGGMTAGALTVFLAYLARFFQPVRTLSQMTNTIAQVSVGFQRVTAVCDADVTIPERPSPIDPPPFKGAITFEHVSFSYDTKAPVLQDISFSVEAGQMVGIVGPTGGGKSTLVSLIPRFRNISGGRITIDGVDISDYTLHGLRTQIAFVLQNTVLLRGSIRDNIAFGCPDASEQQIVEAAKLANADEFIDRMPDGYGTLVGDRGSTLSGGQRQRIGIARALVRNNPILILDEPTAALDAESEHLVVEALERLMAGRTVITIAHRLSTLRDADKIVVIKNGVVAEDGPPEELLRRNGVYAELHRLQFEQSN
ncbi:ABC transporter [Mycobacterium sp. 852013-50091_SCH5140682]|uniref:ABC transporter ATP-binding protein n=1 Tax=Mycobacterium sp. 852013-50091_SCH5140682 TaxID=1834109 RepID=UPI0007EA20CE|nr:ABC transporter ATP-binding protein [Mycobacterium sp. 852013-50091_SCH5140682]OBC01827.1 ABC transporter [Mycobacterium sp. 852013-50091_SCH5140682]